MELMELNPLTLRSRYVLTHFDFFLIRDRVENDMRNYLTARPIWGETFSFFFAFFYLARRRNATKFLSS